MLASRSTYGNSMLLDKENDTDVASLKIDKQQSKSDSVANVDAQSHCEYDKKNIGGMEHKKPPKAKKTPVSVKKILANWTNIKQSIDPMPLLKELHKRKLLKKADFKDLGEKRRSHQTTLVLLATCKSIHSEEDFQKFTESIRTLSSSVAEKLDLEIQEPPSQSVKPSDVEKDLLYKLRSELEDKLHPDDLLTVLDDFIKTFVFDTHIVEQIIDDFPGKKANTLFVDMILSHLELGSFTCLRNNLQKLRNYKRFQSLIPSVPSASETGLEPMAKLEVDCPANDDLIAKIKDDPNIRISCKQTLNSKYDVTPGSIVFHLKAVDGMDIPKVTDAEIKKFLHSLFQNEHIKSDLLKCQKEVNWTYTVDDDITNCATCNLEPIDILRANRLFLINEINVSTLITSFAKRNEECFDHIELEKDIDLPEKAKRFIDTLLRTPQRVIDMFWDILKEKKMGYVLKRLTQCKHVYESYSNGIEGKINDLENEISDKLDFFMLKDTFKERKIFPSHFFQATEKAHEKNEEQIRHMLKEITQKGPFAVMTLVDVLYINNFDSLAKMLLSGSKTWHSKTPTGTCKGKFPRSGWITTEKTQIKGTYDPDENSVHLRMHPQDHGRPVASSSTASSISSYSTESGYFTENGTNSRTNSRSSNSMP